MSAFVVSQNHIRYLVNLALVKECYPWDLSDPTKLGQWLWDANVKSVDYRYDNRHHENVVYEHGAPCAMSDGQSLKAIDCFDYQSCECPDYNESDVKLFVDRLRNTVSKDREVPGYEEAKWCID